jgi:Na+/H+ antiporter NhaC|tara:strand:+ start:110 stop:448 length:339 start_codon:yes stop_codon:yes gene_type:complete
MIEHLLQTIKVIMKIIIHAILLAPILFHVATVTTKHNGISHDTSIESYLGYYYCMDNTPEPERSDEKEGCGLAHTPLTYIYETLFLIIIYSFLLLLYYTDLNDQQRPQRYSD